MTLSTSHQCFCVSWTFLPSCRTRRTSFRDGPVYTSLNNFQIFSIGYADEEDRRNNQRESELEGGGGSSKNGKFPFHFLFIFMLLWRSIQFNVTLQYVGIIFFDLFFLKWPSFYIFALSVSVSLSFSFLALTFHSFQCCFTIRSNFCLSVSSILFLLFHVNLSLHFFDFFFSNDHFFYIFALNQVVKFLIIY
jgi:hypothetical protein